MNALNIWRAIPIVFASGAPKSPTPQKFVPLFRQNLVVRVKSFECAIRAPPRPVRDKNSETVPWSTFQQNRFYVFHINAFFSSYKNFTFAKKCKSTRLGAPYDPDKSCPSRFRNEFFWPKNRKSHWPQWSNRKRRTRSRVT